MRTFAARQRDLSEQRYEDIPEVALDQIDMPTAKRMLASRGGKLAAKVALAELWETKKRHPQNGYRPTATISAPLRVLIALETVGLIEVADDDRGVALRYKLTTTGVEMFARKEGV